MSTKYHQQCDSNETDVNEEIRCMFEEADQLNNRILARVEEWQEEREKSKAILKELAQRNKKLKKGSKPEKSIDVLMVKLKAAIDEEVEEDQLRWTHKHDLDDDSEGSTNPNTLQFGTLTTPVNCNMVLTLPFIFWI